MSVNYTPPVPKQRKTRNAFSILYLESEIKETFQIRLCCCAAAERLDVAGWKVTAGGCVRKPVVAQ